MPSCGFITGYSVADIVTHPLQAGGSPFVTTATRFASAYLSKAALMGTDGGGLTVICCQKLSNDTGVGGTVIATSANNRIILGNTHNGAASVMAATQIRDSANSILALSQTGANYTGSTAWMSVGWAYNSTGSLVMVRNGVDVTGTATISSGTIERTEAVHWNGQGGPQTGTPVDYSMIFIAAEYVDLVTNWNNFFSSEDNIRPLNWGSDGSVPTGRAPEYFAPDGDLTNNQGSAGNWSVAAGTLSAAPTSPTD